MPKIDLLPCPYCGSSRVKFYRVTGMYEVACSDCRCTSGIEGTKEAAAAAWNTRASGWIPCSERMPGRFDTVLLAILSKNGFGEPAYYVTIGGMNGNEFEAYTGDICECETVTNWMPIPAPPEVT